MMAQQRELAEVQKNWEALTFHIKDELYDFRDKHGRSWKRKLRDLWESGHDTGALRTIRDMIGPVGLDEIYL